MKRSSGKLRTHCTCGRFCRIALINRTGEAKSTVLRLTGQAGELVKRSVRETRRLATRLSERARGLLLPAPTTLGNPSEDTLLAATADELKRLGLTPRDVALDGGFNPGPTATALPDAERVFIVGRQSIGSRYSDRRLAKKPRSGWSVLTCRSGA